MTQGPDHKTCILCSWCIPRIVHLTHCPSDLEYSASFSASLGQTWPVAGRARRPSSMRPSKSENSSCVSRVASPIPAAAVGMPLAGSCFDRWPSSVSRTRPPNLFAPCCLQTQRQLWLQIFQCGWLMINHRLHTAAGAIQMQTWPLQSTIIFH